MNGCLVMIELQREFPSLKRILFEAYMSHERNIIEQEYQRLLQQRITIDREEYIRQYVQSGFAERFHERFGHYYGR